MLTEVRKLQIIEALLKTEDENTLSAVEDIMHLKNGHNENKSNRFDDLVGTISEEDAEEMKRIIEENFEKINENDWK